MSVRPPAWRSAPTCWRRRNRDICRVVRRRRRIVGDDPGTLERLKNWMEKNNAVLVAAILVLTGFVVLYKGIHAL